MPNDNYLVNLGKFCGDFDNVLKVFTGSLIAKEFYPLTFEIGFKFLLSPICNKLLHFDETATSHSPVRVALHLTLDLDS